MKVVQVGDFGVWKAGFDLNSAERNEYCNDTKVR